MKTQQRLFPCDAAVATSSEVSFSRDIKSLSKMSNQSLVTVLKNSFKKIIWSSHEFKVKAPFEFISVEEENIELSCESKLKTKFGKELRFWISIKDEYLLQKLG